MSNEIKTTYDEGHDVEFTKRGLMNVKISYMTTEKNKTNKGQFDTTFTVDINKSNGYNNHQNTFSEHKE